MGNTPEILGEYLRAIFFGNTNASLAIDELDEQFVAFGEGLEYFARCFFEYNRLARALAAGDLSVPLPSRDNSLTDSLKSLYASLKHLTWQTQQVARGDYTQRIDFMGDFSDAFNTMVEQLAERQSRLVQKNIDLQWKVIELQGALLKTMAELIDRRDNTTGGHIDRTQSYLGILIDAILKKGLYESETQVWDVDLVLQSSQLHDLGKIAIEDSILKKPGQLTDEEFAKIKVHTTFGKSIIEKIKLSTTEHEFLDYAAIFAISHHEKWDGSGYPDGLRGESIPLLGRLLAIADVYDALTSERPYKKAFEHEKAVSIILDSAGTHFEPALADMFVDVAGEFQPIADPAVKSKVFSFNWTDKFGF